MIVIQTIEHFGNSSHENGREVATVMAEPSQNL